MHINMLLKLKTQVSHIVSSSNSLKIKLEKVALIHKLAKTKAWCFLAILLLKDQEKQTQS